jgi:hypothetical protein
MVLLAAVMPPKRRRRRGPKPRQPFDKRTLLGRRVVELVDTFRVRLGVEADDPLVAAAIRRAAETVALAEKWRARMLRGERVSTETVLRLTRTADLLTRKLGLDKPRPQPAGPSLADYLRAHHDGGGAV